MVAPQDDNGLALYNDLMAAAGGEPDPTAAVAQQEESDDPGPDGARLYERLMRRAEPVGFGEAATTRSTGKPKAALDWVPYIATGREGIEWVDIFQAAERFNQGSHSPDDRRMLEDFIDWNARSRGFGAGVGGIVGDATVFMGEFATGASIAGAIGKKALKTAGGKALLEATKKLSQTSVAGAIQKRATTRTLGKLAQAGAQGTAIAAVNELPRAEWGRVMANARRLQFQRRFELSQDEAASLVVEIGDMPSSLADVLPQAILNEAIEYGSEMAGGAIPIVGRLDALQDDIVSHFIGRVGLEKGREIIRHAGFHGVWSEIGEEYLGAAVREGTAAVGGEEFAEFEGQLPETFGQTLEMYAGFGLMGSTRRGVGALAEKALGSRQRESMVEQYRQDAETAAAAGLDAPTEQDIQARVDREMEALGGAGEPGLVAGEESESEGAEQQEAAEALSEGELEQLEALTPEDVAALTGESAEAEEPEAEPVENLDTEQAPPTSALPDAPPESAALEEGAPTPVDEPAAQAEESALEAPAGAISEVDEGFDASRIARAEGRTVQEYREVDPETGEEKAAVRLGRRLRPDLTVRFVEGMRQGGAYVAPGEILIRKGAESPARILAAHEAAHDFVAASGGTQRGNWLDTFQELRRVDPTGMRAARELHRAGWMADMELEDSAESRAQYNEAHPKGVRKEEALATYAGEVAGYLEMLGSESGERHLMRLARRDLGVFQRVMDWIRRTWERVTGRSDFDAVAAQHGLRFPEGPRREAAMGAIMLRDAMASAGSTEEVAEQAEAEDRAEREAIQAEANVPDVGVKETAAYREARAAGQPVTAVEHVKALGGIDLRGASDAAMRSESGDAWALLNRKEFGKGYPAGVLKGPNSKAKEPGLSPDDMASALAEAGFVFEGGEADPNQVIEWVQEELAGGEVRMPTGLGGEIAGEQFRGAPGVGMTLDVEDVGREEDGDYVPFAPASDPRFASRPTGSGPVSVAYVRSTDSATDQYGIPDADSPFDRGYEPAGEYFTPLDRPKDAGSLPSNLETGTHEFRNALVLPLGSYGAASGWKRALSEHYGGLTGRDLSRAVIADGYDAILTQDHGEFSEGVNLQTFEYGLARFAPDMNTPSLGERVQFLDEQAWEAARQQPLGKWDSFRRAVQDNALAVQRLQETIAKAGGNVSADPRTTIANMPGRVQDRAKEIEAARDFILRRMRREDHWGLGVDGAVDMLGDVLYAEFAPEVNEYLREKEGVIDGSGMSDAEAQAVLDEHADKPGVADIVARFRRDIIEGTRDQMASGGVVSQETVDAWREMFPNYVPLRTADIDADGPAFVGPRGGGMQVTGPIYHERQGRKTRADNPFVFGFAQAQSMNLASEKARVGRDLWDMMRHEDNVGLVSYTELEQPDDPGDWKPENAFGVWIDGERKVLRLESDDVNRAMKNLGYTPVPGWMRLHRSLISTMGKLVTSWDPNFMIPNFFRDLETAGINITAEKKKGVRRRALRNLFPAMRAIAADEFKGKAAPTEMGQFYSNVYRKQGGLIGWTKDVTFEDMMEDVLRGLKAGPVRRTFSSMIGVIEASNSVIEMATRVAFTEALVNAGVPAKQAVRAGRELTVDFNRRGEVTSHLAAYKMFINARIQGAAQMVINAKRNPRIAAIHAGIFAFGFGTALMNILAMGTDDDDEPRFFKKAEWERDRNIMLPNPFAEDPDEMFKVPLTYGYNLFYVMGEAAAEAAYRVNELGEDKGEAIERAAIRSGKVLWDGFSPISDGTWLQAMSPTGATPIVQILENTNWNGQPVMPEGNPFDIAPPPDSERYWHSAAPLSKEIASTINGWFGGNKHRAGEWMGLDMSVSPETLEHVYEGYLGGLAKSAEHGYKLATKPWEDTGWETVPVLRRFYSDDKSVWADRETYYNSREEVVRVTRELKAGEKLPARARAMATLDGLRKATDKRLKSLREQERATEDSDEKRRLRELQHELYRRFNGEVNSIRRGGKRRQGQSSR